MSESAGAPGFPNRNPDLARTLIPPIILVWLFEGFVALLLGLSFANPPIVTGAGLIAVFVGAAVLWGLFAAYVSLAIYRSYRRLAPDWIQIGDTAVVGVYGPHLAGPRSGASSTLPFERVLDLVDAAQDDQGLHTPPHVSAKPLEDQMFDPKSVRALIRGPQVPEGISMGFYLTQANLERLRFAYTAWKGTGLFSPPSAPTPT